MALSIVGDAEAAAASVNLPTFTAGDLAVVFAYRNGNTTSPTVPGGWTTITNSGGANTNSRSVGYRVLQVGDTTTSTWTNATAIAVIVVRGQHSSTPIGASNSGGSNTTTLTTPALTLNVTDGSSWVIAFAGSKATNANTVTLSSTTDEGSSQGALNVATGRGVSSWSSRDYSATVNASANRMDAIEILAASASVAQVGYRFRNNDGTETTATWLGAQNAACALPVNNTFRLRIEAEEQNTRSASVGGQLEVSKNNGAYQDVTTSSTVVKAVTGSVSDGTATTNQLTVSSKTFTAGTVSNDGQAASVSVNNQQAEIEYALQIVGTDVAHGDSLKFRIKALDVYTVTATAAVDTNPPPSVSTGTLLVRFDASLLGLTDNASIATAQDFSGNGRDATQGTAGNQPTFKTNIQNGLPIMRFDGSSDSISTTANFTLGTTYTVFAVVKSTFGADSSMIVSTDNYSSMRIFQLRNHTSTSIGLLSLNTTGGTAMRTETATLSNFNIITGRLAAAGACQTWINGVNGGNATLTGTPMSGSSTCTLGAQNDPSRDQKMNGDIGEVLLYDGALSASERQSVENYLQVKWFGSTHTSHTTMMM